MFSQKPNALISTTMFGQLTYPSKSSLSTTSLSQTSTHLSQLSTRISQSLSSLYLRWLLCVVVMAAIVAKCDADDVIRRTSVETQVVDKYLSTFGYYPEHAHGSVLADDYSSSRTQADVTVGQHTEDERHRAIERLQRFFHLPLSGQLDVSTKKIIKTARCGRKDIVVDDENDEGSNKKNQAGVRRVKRYKLSKYGDGSLANWKTSELTWKISRPSRQISESQQREIIRKSLAMWAEYVPVKFIEDRSQNVPDIDIHFARGEHGPSPDPIFDGSPNNTLNVLAHAWGPGHNAKGLTGDVHFDDDDNWKDYNTLLGVAVHELGHSMGLGHSADANAIMYPVYRDVVKLGQDDIDGIKEMYGTRSGIRPVNPEVIRPMTNAPAVQTRGPDPRTRGPYYTVKPEWVHPPATEFSVDLCSTVDIDAVFEDPTTKIGRVYIALSNENVHTLTQHGQLIKSELLNTVYPDVPINPDVAFSISAKRTVYFIKDDMMWAYKEGKPENGFPRSIRSFQFPERPKFSVTLPQKDGSSRLLLFGTRYWWIFDVDRSSAIEFWPISDFSRQLPSGVRFAARWIDNYLYAVTDDSYVIMDLDMRRITHEKPIAGKPEWLHGLCGHASRASNTMTSLIVLLILSWIFKSLLL